MNYIMDRTNKCLKNIKNNHNIEQNILDVFKLIANRESYLFENVFFTTNKKLTDQGKLVRKILLDLNKNYSILPETYQLIPKLSKANEHYGFSWRTLQKISEIFNISLPVVLRVFDSIGIKTRTIFNVKIDESCLLNLNTYVNQNFAPYVLKTLNDTRTLWFCNSIPQNYCSHLKRFCQTNFLFSCLFKYFDEIITNLPNFFQTRLMLGNVPLYFHLVLASKLLNLNYHLKPENNLLLSKIFKSAVIHYFCLTPDPTSYGIRNTIYNFLKNPQFRFTIDDWSIIFECPFLKNRNVADFIISADADLLELIVKIPLKEIPPYVQEWLLFNHDFVKKHPRFVAKILPKRMRTKNFPVYYAEAEFGTILITEEVVKNLHISSIERLINHISDQPYLFELTNKSIEKIWEKALPLVIKDPTIVEKLRLLARRC